MSNIFKNPQYLLIDILKRFNNITSGSINLKVNGNNLADVVFKKDEILINLDNLQPLKNLRTLIKLPGTEKDIISQLSKARDLAEYIKEKKLTLSLSWRDKLLIVIGNKAKPKMLKLVLKTDAIEIKSIKDLLFLLNQLR